MGLSKPPLHHCHSFLSTTTVSSKQQHSAAANFFFLLGAKRGKGGCDHWLRVCLHPASCVYPSELRASLVLGHQVVLPNSTCHISGSLHLFFCKSMPGHAANRTCAPLNLNNNPGLPEAVSSSSPKKGEHTYPSNKNLCRAHHCFTQTRGCTDIHSRLVYSAPYRHTLCYLARPHQLALQICDFTH